jgi:Fic family protein
MHHWVWKNKEWPNFTWNDGEISKHITAARVAQAELMGMVRTLDPSTVNELNSITLAEQAINTSAIEGETLNRDSVRSSIAHRLGLDHAGINPPVDRYIEGLLDMLTDATENYKTDLSEEKLYAWHAALFPTGYSGISKIEVGSFRADGPMRIISGRPGKEVVHYQAPDSKTVPKNMQQFLAWFNKDQAIDGFVRAGVAHLWFELIHPFDDGNGRVGRAIADLALAQDERLATRYYSLSSAIMHNRKAYYAELERCCSAGLDITAWLIWFINILRSSILNAIKLIDDISLKCRFWQQHATTVLNDRQIKVLNKLLDAGKNGFVGDMTTKKYIGLTKVSRATAYRELNDLVQKRCLQTTAEKGRSAAYQVLWP